jgi:predicted membrane protein
MNPEYRLRGYRENGRGEGKLVLGIFVVLIGIVFLLDNLGVLHFYNVWAFWPALMILLGIVRMITSYSNAGRISGVVLFAVGAILLANNLGYIPWNLWSLFWPLLLIVWGLGMLFRGYDRWGAGFRFGGPTNYDPSTGARTNFFKPPAESIDSLHQWAVFGGSRRRINSQNFQGGEVLAIFGGVRVDLRQAATTLNEVHLDANALFGGVDIRIPANWSVTMRGTGIFGGFEDRSRGDENVIQMNKTTLVVSGMAMFGGVSVKY